MQSERPFFSIVIPTCGRLYQLSACLQAIALMNYPSHQFEVIVVQDGNEHFRFSFDGAIRDQLNIRLIRQEKSGPAAARNKGAAEAMGDILVFTDDDCLPTRNWLETLENRFTGSWDSAVGGRVCNALPNNPYSGASQLLIDYLHVHYNDRPNHARFITSNNLALPTELFNDIGGFDARFRLAGGEDREFCDRWRAHTYRIIYAPEVVVEHFHPLTFSSFLWKHFNYGRGSFLFHRIRSQKNREHRFPESLPFYLNLICYPVSHSRHSRRLLLVNLLLLCQVATAAGLLWEGIRGMITP